MSDTKRSELEVEQPHGFGGCNALRSHYQRIGDELCAIDSGLSRYGLRRDYQNFRVGVATVPVEVLESYCEDLLDIEVPEERLCINRRNLGLFFQMLAIVGLAAAFGWGLWSVARGASLIVSFVMTFFMSAPFAILWHFSPRMQLMRRIGFARIISQEIFRRRGGERGDATHVTTSVLSDFLSSGNSQGSLPGAARKIFH